MKIIKNLIWLISLCFTFNLFLVYADDNLYYDLMIQDLDSRPDNLNQMLHESDCNTPVNEEGTKIRIPKSNISDEFKKIGISEKPKTIYPKYRKHYGHKDKHD